MNRAPAPPSYRPPRRAVPVDKDVAFAAKPPLDSPRMWSASPMVVACDTFWTPATARLARSDGPSIHHRFQSILPTWSIRLCRASKWYRRRRTRAMPGSNPIQSGTGQSAPANHATAPGLENPHRAVEHLAGIPNRTAGLAVGYVEQGLERLLLFVVPFLRHYRTNPLSVRRSLTVGGW